MPGEEGTRAETEREGRRERRDENGTGKGLTDYVIFNIFYFHS